MPKLPWRWFSVLMIVAYDCSGVAPTFVASNTSGSVVFWMSLGFVFATVTAGVHSEQKMLRVESAVPSLLLVTLGMVGIVIIGVTCGACAGSPRNLASRMWLVAFAANTEHTITTAPPRTQK